MDALEAIMTRRSIRRYTSDPVPEESVRILLEAAMAAPTAADEPWHFVVVRERKLLDEVTRYHHHAHMLKQASVAITVCADPTSGSLRDRWPLDCAAATENILIAANALGLGACWVGIYPVEERILGVKGLLGIPDPLIPLCMVALGFPAERKQPSQRYRPERVHYDTW
jgi:nitroreductase